jgi:hypothetical protein
MKSIARRRLVGVLGIAFALVASAAPAETFRDGLRAYRADDFASAHAIWLMLAKRGDANAQSSLGYLYYAGRGVTHDGATAARWFYLAAVQGEPTAQALLCGMYLRGEGVEPNLELALLWCELSIEGGDTRGTHPREQALEQMTNQQREAAWRLIAEWRRRHIELAKTQPLAP